jgi:hypothetical protein
MSGSEGGKAMTGKSPEMRKFFAISLWRYRYVFRIKRGPLGQFTVEMERGLKRWY